MHPAVLRLTSARLLELTTNIGMFALVTSQYGHTAISILLTTDCIAIVSIVVGTWHHQGRTLAGSSHSLVGVLRRSLLALPMLLGLHWDHIPGRVGNVNSIADPRAYYLWRIVRHGLLTIAVLINIQEMTNMTSRGWYAVGFAIVTLSAGLMLPLINSSYWKYQEMVDLPRVGLRMPLPKRCRRELSDENHPDHQKNDGSQEGKLTEHERNRRTLMALYGSKAAEMENAGKEARAEHARIEALKKAGKWPPKYETKDDHVVRKEEKKDPFQGKTVVLDGVNVDAVMELTRQLMNETEPKCHGCEGLSLLHDEHLCKLDPRKRYLSGKKSKLKSRYQLPEPTAEHRSQRLRSHVELPKPPPSLSEDASRIGRAINSPKNQNVATNKYIVLKQRIPLSEQARIPAMQSMRFF